MGRTRSPKNPPQDPGTIRIRQVRSAIGTKPQHREALRGLGLRRIRHEVERQDSPSLRGMIAKVSFLVEVIEG